MRHLLLAGLVLLPLGSCASDEAKSATCSVSQKAPRPLAATHTVMPYPPISSRLNEQGVTMMVVAISDDGVPTDVAVKQTSGSNRLDEAAINYIRAHWRWQKPKDGCGPAATTVNVAWHISEPPIPKSGVEMERGVEVMTIYTLRVHSVE